MSSSRNFLVLTGLIGIIVLIHPIDSFGETWRVQIPSGASDPTVTSHFLPHEITVRVGDFVEWGNADTVVHTATSGTLETGPDGRFDSGHIKPGSQFRLLFGEEYMGENKYFCTLHPWLTGIINVANVEEGFQVIHNVGSEVSETTFDVQYKVKRNLVNAVVEPEAKSITFNFAGKISNDNFVVKLPKRLLENPQGVWVNDKQITNFESTQSDSITTLRIPLVDNSLQVKITGARVIGEIKPKPTVLINQILAISDKKVYYPDDDITISGQIINPTQLFHVTIQVISPSKVTLYSEDVPLQDGSKFTTTINATDALVEFGKYNIKIIGKDAKNLIIPFDYKLEPKEQLPPRQQMEMKIPPSDVVCNEGLKLMQKEKDGSAICVKPTTADALIQRGWATYFS